MSTSTTSSTDSTRLSIRERGQQARKDRTTKTREPLSLKSLVKSTVRTVVKTTQAVQEVTKDLPQHIRDTRETTLDLAYGLTEVAGERIKSTPAAVKGKFQAVKAECSDIWNAGLEEVNQDLNKQ